MKILDGFVCSYAHFNLLEMDAGILFMYVVLFHAESTKIWMPYSVPFTPSKCDLWSNCMKSCVGV